MSLSLSSVPRLLAHLCLLSMVVAWGGCSSDTPSGPRRCSDADECGGHAVCLGGFCEQSCYPTPAPGIRGCETGTQCASIDSNSSLFLCRPTCELDSCGAESVCLRRSGCELRCIPEGCVVADPINGRSIRAASSHGKNAYFVVAPLVSGADDELWRVGDDEQYTKIATFSGAVAEQPTTIRDGYLYFVARDAATSRSLSRIELASGRIEAVPMESGLSDGSVPEAPEAGLIHDDWLYTVADTRDQNRTMRPAIERMSLRDPSLRQVIVEPTQRATPLEGTLYPFVVTDGRLYLKSDAALRVLSLPSRPCNERAPCPEGQACSRDGLCAADTP